MSDRIALVHRGRIEQVGEVHEIYHRPATAFAAEFIGHANLLAAECVAVDGPFARIRLHGGLELRIPAGAWPVGATRAKVSIRPEKLHLSKLPLPETNAFAARVEEEVFKGATDRFTLATAAGTRLHAVVANESALRDAIHLGDHVWCAIHTDDIVVVA